MTRRSPINNSQRTDSGRPAFVPASRCLYLAFYKPFEVLCQFSPADSHQTGLQGPQKITLADFGFPQKVYPVGRLDYDSEGLLVLSDDGRLTSRLFDEDKPHDRTYLVQVENIPSKESLRALESGVPVEGRLTKPALARLLTEAPMLPERSKPIRYRKNIPTAWLSLTLREGRNRQVRKMTAFVGHPTLRLVRRSIGSLDLFSLGLAPGQWKELTSDEVLKLFSKGTK